MREGLGKTEPFFFTVRFKLLVLCKDCFGIGMKNENKGFTLSELLIVVAIIAVLVAIAIPVFSTQLHKSRVATDWANVRGYYAELQADFMEHGPNNDYLTTDFDGHYESGFTSFKSVSGNEIQLKEGRLWVALMNNNRGYNLFYMCDKQYSHPDCMLTLPTK